MDRHIATTSSASTEQSSIENERRRIGRELHDAVAQCFLGISLHAAAVYESLDDAQSLREGLEKIHLLALEGLTETRTLSLGLNPPSVDSLGLVAALRLLAFKMTVAGRLECTFVDEANAEPVPALVASCFYRIAQEAIQNAARHGNARRVRLRLSLAKSGWKLKVTDDGVGPGSSIPSAPVPRTIDAHLAALGGACRTRRLRGDSGFELVAFLPIYS